MTSVGYGDIGPQNILERIVCTVMVMCPFSTVALRGRGSAYVRSKHHVLHDADVFRLQI